MSGLLLNGSLLHYESWGHGPPLILLHGWLGSWRYWMRTMETLAPDLRAYALDLWGFGDSAKARGRYDLVSYVQLLGDFMENMGMERVHLVGHALGAAVALALAASRPEQVERLALISPPLHSGAIQRTLRTLSEPLGDEPARQAENGLWAKRLLASAKVGHPEVIGEAPKADPEAILASARSLATAELAKELRRVKAPTLAIFGRHDPVVSSDQAALVERNPRRMRAVILEKSRHFPMLDEPVEFHRLLRDFLVDGEAVHALEIKQMWHRRTH